MLHEHSLRERLLCTTAQQQQHLGSPVSAGHSSAASFAWHSSAASFAWHSTATAGSAPTAHVDTSVAARIQSGIRTINASGSVAISAIF
eukprot:g11230.t1